MRGGSGTPRRMIALFSSRLGCFGSLLLSALLTLALVLLLTVL